MRGSLWSFYKVLFAGIYPAGNLSWHHYWFVVYLSLFCFLGWPLLAYLRSRAGQNWIAARSSVWLRGAWIYAFAIVLLTFEILLRPLFPGFRDLIHDWASFAHWFLVFIAGFVMAQYEPLLMRIEKLRHFSLCLALFTCALLFIFFLRSDGHSFHPFPDGNTSVPKFLVFSAVRMLNAWCWLLVCIGFAARHLRHSSPVLAYLNGAVYPLFCVHLTLVVGFGHWVLTMGLGVWESYLLVCGLTVFGSLGAYEVIRRVVWLRPLFGLKSSA